MTERRHALRRTTRFLAMAMAVLMAVSLPSGLSGFEARALTEDEINQKLDQLEKEKEQLKQNIKNNSGAVTDLAEEQENLRQQASVVQQQIDLVIQQLTTLEQQIEDGDKAIVEKEQAIAQKEEDNKENYSRLQQRLRAIGKGGNMSVFQMLMNTEDYTEYLIKSEVMERVAEADQNLIDSIDEEIRSMNAEKDALETEKADVASQKEKTEKLRQENVKRKQELDNLSKTLHKNELKLQAQIQQDQEALKKKEQQEKELEEELRKLSEKGDEDYKGQYGGGTMFWPVPAVHNISSGFGYRWGKLHRGVDIANGSVAIYGQKVVAAADGVVIYANPDDNRTGTSKGGGYGYFIMVDHGVDAKGRRIVTLYAHNSKLLVNKGDMVKGGETVLALAGNTGDVTGPHLHFEVRVDGTAVDPLKNGYLAYNKG